MSPHTKTARIRSDSAAPSWDRTLRIALVLALIAIAGAGCRDQDSSDTPPGSQNTPTASFTNGTTRGTPGLTVQFQDTSTGALTARNWDFGNGITSTLASPVVVYPDAGVFTVTLAVSGSRGTSTVTSTNLVQVGDVPNADFACTVEIGFAPVATSCNNTGSASSGTTHFHWDFGDGTISIVENPNHTYATPGDYTVTQTITTPGGVDTLSTTIRVLPLTLSVISVTGGGGPGLFGFIADTGGIVGNLASWTIGGVPVGTANNILVQLNTPGTVTAVFTFLSTEPFLTGTATIEHTVGFGPPIANFTPSQSEGPGPLSVVMNDDSTGQIVVWEWNFGDGTTCDFPTLVSSATLCNAASPTHIYTEIGEYNVSLTVRGLDPSGNPTLSDVVDQTERVRVTILDPSFERQTTGTEIAGAWTSIRPASATATANHIALSSAAPGSADAGMPTAGSKWAALDGLGTNGSTPALTVENGIRTTFLKPTNESVLEFDYAFLYSEPTLAGVPDEMTATVSARLGDGTLLPPVEILSAQADVETPYGGGSVRFPTLGNSQTRLTPVQTASLDLASAFPGAALDTIYTLTIRLTNDVNAQRSPRAYVDAIRFAETADPMVAAFDFGPGTVVAGQPTSFTDETCPSPGPSTCEVPTSFRWDFDTHLLASPPAVTGSNQQNPTYVFPEVPPLGYFDVVLVTRNGDQESVATRRVTVIDGPVASFTAVFTGTTTAPATIQFTDTSTPDVFADPIVSHSWDFVGWASPAEEAAQGPHTVAVLQAGSYTFELTVTTSSGQASTSSIVVIVD